MGHERSLIDKFLACRRIAVVGVSRNPSDFTRQIWKEFRSYDATPVHPDQAEVDGIPCAPNVRAIDPRPEAALILVAPGRRRTVLEDCHAAGIGLVWIFGVSGPRSIPLDLLRWCDDRQMRVIAGYCPYMFLPSTPWPHRLHGTIAKFIGLYPA